MLDKAEEKAAFDAVLVHAEATAAQQKAIADKALVDFGELQVCGRVHVGLRCCYSPVRESASGALVTN